MTKEEREAEKLYNRIEERGYVLEASLEDIGEAVIHVGCVIKNLRFAGVSTESADTILASLKNLKVNVRAMAIENYRAQKAQEKLLP